MLHAFKIKACSKRMRKIIVIICNKAFKIETHFLMKYIAIKKVKTTIAKYPIARPVLVYNNF